MKLSIFPFFLGNSTVSPRRAIHSSGVQRLKPTLFSALITPSLIGSTGARAELVLSSSLTGCSRANFSCVCERACVYSVCSPARRKVGDVVGEPPRSFINRLTHVSRSGKGHVTCIHREPCAREREREVADGTKGWANFERGEKERCANGVLPFYPSLRLRDGGFPGYLCFCDDVKMAFVEK